MADVTMPQLGETAITERTITRPAEPAATHSSAHGQGASS